MPFSYFINTYLIPFIQARSRFYPVISHNNSYFTLCHIKIYFGDGEKNVWWVFTRSLVENTQLLSSKLGNNNLPMVTFWIVALYSILEGHAKTVWHTSIEDRSLYSCYFENLKSYKFTYSFLHFLFVLCFDAVNDSRSSVQYFLTVYALTCLAIFRHIQSYFKIIWKPLSTLIIMILVYTKGELNT